MTRSHQRAPRQKKQATKSDIAACIEGTAAVWLPRLLPSMMPSAIEPAVCRPTLLQVSKTVR